MRPSAALASSGRAGLHNRREWGLITKYVNYSTTKTTLNMIQVFKDEKDKYFLDYPNTSTELSFILTSLRLAAEAGLQSPIRNHFDDLH